MDTISQMKVIISVGGKFHAFYLARELEKRGHLLKLYTSYPRFASREGLLPGRKVKTFVFREIVCRLLRDAPFPALRDKLCLAAANHYDQAVAGSIPLCDIFVGWSGFFLKSALRARKLGALTVVERGSSHISFQKDILEEERRLSGVALGMPSLDAIRKELKEYAFADYICVPSNFARKTFLEKGVPENKLICIPYGVDPEVFYPLPKSPDLFRIIFVGALVMRKGVRYLLEAASALRLKKHQTWLIGGITDEIRPVLRKYRDCFEWKGKVAFNSLNKYYSAGSVFVLPSLEEGLAMVIPQAMACGLPVVCSVNSGGADLLRDGHDGFVVPIRNTEALAEKILYLRKHKGRCQEMGQEARRRVLSEFSWQHYGDRIAKEYQNILRHRQ